MSGGLIQLAAFGTQDILLTANPQITFFKVTIRRHTAFAIESIMQTITGSGTTFGSDLTVTIARSGDLLWRTNIEVVIPQLIDNYTTPTGVTGTWTPARWTDDIGHHLIQSCEVQIGGQRIDKHYSDWLQIWSQLTVPAEKRDGYNRMIGNVMELCGCPDHPSFNASSQNLIYNRSAYRIFVPLQFWFCRSPGMALPLIALPYHEVKLMIRLNDARNLIIPGSINTSDYVDSYDSSASSVTSVAGTSATYTVSNPADTISSTPLEMQVWADYIYLDVNERKRFAQTSHEYLIDQLQYTGGQNISASVNEAQLTLNFNHPTKELVWVLRKDSYTKQTIDHVNNPHNVINQWSNYQICAYDAMRNNYSNVDGRINGNMTFGNMSTTDFNPVSIARLQINGNDRFRDRVGEYFNVVQTYQHHTCIPQSKGINVYSFGLTPEDIQPTGTINFSRIDNTQLIIRVKDTIPAVPVGLVGFNDESNTVAYTANSTINANSKYIVREGGNAVPIGYGPYATNNASVSVNPTRYVADTTDITGYNVLVYATNFNVLRIISGMGGLAFSN